MDHGISFGEAARTWWRIALLSFGGPAGQIALMHRVLVDEKKWIGEGRFLHALNFCMLLPGPEAQQLAIYIGWLLHKAKGGLVAGILFVLPGAVAIMAFSIVYALYGALAPFAALFFGLKAAVLAIVFEAVRRIGARALKSRESRWLAAAAFVALFFFDAAFPLVVLAAGLIGWLAGRRGSRAFAGGGHGGGEGGLSDAESALGEAVPGHAKARGWQAWRLPLLLLILWVLPTALMFATLGPDNRFSEIASFFSQLAMVTFGGAYAVLAYVAQAAVENHGWLTATEMLDGLGLAETTPGPLIMVTQFVGFLAGFRDAGALWPLWSGIFAGLLTTWVTFVPCFLWIFAGAPYVERLRANAALASALAAITAAVVGVILNLALWFALHFLFAEVEAIRAWPLAFDLPVWKSLDSWAAALSALALIALLRFRMGVVPLLLASALAGLWIKFLA